MDLRRWFWSLERRMTMRAGVAAAKDLCVGLDVISDVGDSWTRGSVVVAHVRGGVGEVLERFHSAGYRGTFLLGGMVMGIERWEEWMRVRDFLFVPID